jgi:hypothetical protein
VHLKIGKLSEVCICIPQPYLNLIPMGVDDNCKNIYGTKLKNRGELGQLMGVRLRGMRVVDIENTLSSVQEAKGHVTARHQSHHIACLLILCVWL